MRLFGQSRLSLSGFPWDTVAIKTQMSIVIDRVQRKMIRISQADRTRPEETPEAFVFGYSKSAHVCCSRARWQGATRDRRVREIGHVFGGYVTKEFWSHSSLFSGLGVLRGLVLYSKPLIVNVR